MPIDELMASPMYQFRSLSPSCLNITPGTLSLINRLTVLAASIVRRDDTKIVGGSPTVLQGDLGLRLYENILVRLTLKRYNVYFVRDNFRLVWSQDVNVEFFLLYAGQQAVTRYVE